MFVSLPIELEEPINKLPETSARIEGALKFCWYISGDEKILHAEEPKATRRRESFFRASLAEYVSIEDTLKRDLVKLNKVKITDKTYRITDSKNPMLHIVRELRNLEIHLSSSQLSENKKDVVWCWKNEEHQHQKTIWTVNDFTVEKFKNLRNAKYYSDKDIKEMVKWLNEAQNDWGIENIIFRSICETTSNIVKIYSL